MQLKIGLAENPRGDDALYFTELLTDINQARDGLIR